MNRSLAVLSLCAAVWACGAARALDVVLTRIDGDELAGPLEALDAEKGVTVGGKAVPLGEVEELRAKGARAEPAVALPQIVIRNGDTLAAGLVSGNDNELKVKSEILGELTLKNAVLRGIVFRPKVPPPESAVEAFMGGKNPEEDHLLTDRGETLNGFMERFSDKELAFEVGGQKRQHPYENLAAFRYAALEAFQGAEGVQAVATLADGSRLSGLPAGVADGRLNLKASENLTWSLPLAKLVGLAVRGGKLVYLSDLEPKAVEELPLVGGAPVVMRWRKNLAANGTPLKIAKQDYDRGVGVHSYCKLTYELGGNYALFLAEVGLDASAHPSAACAWKVLADGKELAQGVSAAGEAAKKVKLEVKGAQSLELICDYGSDNDDMGDLLNWAKARLVR
ncbi:MAG: NPCBM/NEW2 domain-containing protein [Planctomycetota bacterium]|nr:NPCBM/NEW2 domain-containing protein [Planctomycetota bacterium]